MRATATRAPARVRATYTAHCVRSGDWWAIEVPEVRGVFTQARRLDQAEEMARDAIAAMLKVSPKSFDVAVIPLLSPDLAASIDAAKELRATAEQYQREATLAARQVVRKLFDRCHLSVRDIGRLLGISYQRVSQLLDSRTRL